MSLTYGEEQGWRQAGESAIRLEMEARVTRRLAQIAAAKIARRRADVLRAQTLTLARRVALIVPTGGVGL